MINSMQVQSGSFKVVESTDGSKYIEAVTAGGLGSICSFESPYAYGTWEQDAYVDTSSSSPFLVIDFVSESSAGANLKVSNGYTVIITSSSNIALRKNSPTSYSDIATFSKVFSTGWYNIKVTRTLDGAMKVYLDGDLILSAIDTSYTESKFFCFHPYGDKYRIRNIRHYPGVRI